MRRPVTAMSRGVGGKAHRLDIGLEHLKRINAGMASDDEADEVIVFSKKDEDAMGRIYEKAKAKMPASPPAAAAPPPTAPAKAPAAIGAAPAPSIAPAATIPSSTTTSTATAPVPSIAPAATIPSSTTASTATAPAPSTTSPTTP